MQPAPYTKFEGEDLILRDELAIDRTLLANERTLLAYLRSGVALVIAGLSIMNFTTHHGWFWTVGIACLPSGIVVAIVGIVRYRNMNSTIALVRKKKKPPQPSPASGPAASALTPEPCPASKPAAQP